MALDEALLLLRRPTPVLRFYTWKPACVSIGYSQSFAAVRTGACEAMGIDVVRRPTGGGAVLHDAELTYSLVAAESTPSVSGTVIESYRKVSAALITGLGHLGISAMPATAHNPVAASGACFQDPSAYELTVNGMKIAGSAQCRRESFLLQHGSLPLKFDHKRTADVLQQPGTVTPAALAETLRQRATGLQEALGRRVDFAEVAASIEHGFHAALDFELELSYPDREELELTRRLRREKYAWLAWTACR